MCERGYALIESLLAAVILATGLLVAISIFCVSASTSFQNQQRAVATLLAHDKIEELRATIGGRNHTTGGSLDPNHSVSGFREFISINGRQQASHLRLWEVRDNGMLTVTVAIFSLSGTSTPVELVRLSSVR